MTALFDEDLTTGFALADLKETISLHPADDMVSGEKARVHDETPHMWNNPTGDDSTDSMQRCKNWVEIARQCSQEVHCLCHPKFARAVSGDFRPGEALESGDPPEKWMEHFCRMLPWRRMVWFLCP